MDRFERSEPFIKIDGCGKSTDKELINFCISFYDLNPKIRHSDIDENLDLFKTSHEEKTDLIGTLSTIKTEILAIKFDGLWSNLTIRIQNAYRKVADNNSLDFYLNNQSFIFSVLSQQAGVGNIQSLVELGRGVNEYAKYLDTLGKAETLFEYNKSMIISSLKCSLNFGDIPYDNNGNIQTFKYIDLLINKKILEKAELITQYELHMLSDYFLYYVDSKRNTLESVAILCGLSKERIRQIRNKFIETGFDKAFDHIRKLRTNTFEEYNIDRYSTLLFIFPKQITQINENEGTRFSSLFITKLVALMLADTHTLIGNEIELHNENKPRYEALLRNMYIVSNEVYAQFSINDFINDIHNRLSDTISDTYTIPVRGLLAKHVSGDEKWSVTERLVPFAETLLLEEFSIIIQDEQITFDRNTRKLEYEYAKEALESLKPSQEGYHIDTILERVHSLYPDKQGIESNSLISAILRERPIFGAIGRQSRYILRSWEKTFPNTRAGTIRDIVEDYLIMSDEIKHIGDITNYVIEKRPDTYGRSILDNLKADKSGRFRFFPNYRVGLTSKEYDLSEVIIRGKATFLSRTHDLKQFIEEHDREPTVASSIDEDEKRLYYFMRKYVSQIAKSTILDHKLERWIALNLPMS